MKSHTKVICIAILVLSGTLTLGFWAGTREADLYVVKIEGDTHFELGKDYGQKCKEKIGGVFAALPEFFSAFEILSGKTFDEFIAETEPNVPAELVEEMRGVAEGAGVTYREVFILNMAAEIMMIVQKPHNDAAAAGVACSQFAKVNQTDPTLGPIFGRTLDFLPNTYLQNFQVVLQFECEGTKFIGHTIAGMVGFMTGMNDRGLVASASVIATEEVGDAIPWVHAIRWVLQHYTTVEQAANFLMNARHGFGWNFMLMDAAGQAAVVEATHDHNNTRWVADEGPGGYICATNQFHSEVMFPYGPDQLTSRTRKATMEKYLAAEPEFDLQDAIQLLGNSWDGVVQATNPGIHTINRRWIRKTFVPTGTLGSMVAVPRLNYAVVCMGYPDSGVWYAVTFEEVIGPIA